MILGQNFHISIKSVFSEIRPGNDVWRWCRVCTRSSLPYMEISNFDGGHLGFFAMILGQNVTFPLSLCTVKSDLEMMFGDGVECVQGHLYHIWRFQILMVAILDFLPRGLPMILGQNVTFLLRLGSHLRQTFEMSEDIADNFVSELV